MKKRLWFYLFYNSDHLLHLGQKSQIKKFKLYFTLFVFNNLYKKIQIVFFFYIIAKII